MTFTQDQRPKMTVNVSLCGSIPRSEMIAFGSCHHRKGLAGNETGSFIAEEGNSAMSSVEANCPSSEESATSMTLPSTTCPSVRVPDCEVSGFISHPRQSSEETLSIAAQRLSALQSKAAEGAARATRCTMHGALQATPQSVEPPHWAVAARGEAHLEPVCESIGSHSRVDLTNQAYFRIGRSPSSDVQLMHATSSRRHAILFHHPNGSCYVVDCGSAHGTYVNGVRVQTTVTRSGSDSSGMVIPFRIRKGSLIRFGGIGAPTFILKSFAVGIDALIRDLGSVSEVPSSIPDLEDANGSHNLSPAWISQTKETDAAVVLLNTRINAVGSSSTCRPHQGRSPFSTVSFESLDLLDKTCNRNAVTLKRRQDSDQGEVVSNKRHCVESTDPESVECSMPKFVSPSVSPVREWSDGDLLKTPLKLPPPPPLSLGGCGLKITLPPKNRLSRRHRRVSFCGDEPVCFFAPSVTPDDLSDEDLEIESSSSLECPLLTPTTPRPSF